MKLGYVFLVFLFFLTCSRLGFASEDKTFINTGATGELGGATAKLLAIDHNLIITGRDVGKLKKLQDELTNTYSHKYTTCPLDFTSPSSRENFKHFLSRMREPISGLVMIGPRSQFHGKELMQEEDVWLEVFQKTFTGPNEVLKATIPYLLNPSKIVVIAGTTSVQLQPEYGPSCMIRRLWTTYTKALAHQLGPKGISVNALSPGIVLTNFHEGRIEKQARDKGISYENQMEKEVASIPLRRHAQPQEVAQTIKFLLTESSDFITGVNLVLDGGYTLTY